MAAISSPGALRTALNGCRRHFVAAAGFSALVNLLYIAPTLYMLQVYDRVVPTQGRLTLLFVTLVLLFALATLALLDRIRARLLVRAGVQLDTALAPVILDATLGRPGLSGARQALREFDVLRGTMSGQAILAAFDAPWVPIYIIVCFLVHPWIGAVAIFGCLILPAIAWANERTTHDRLIRAQEIASASYANQEVVLGSADAVRALGMRRAMVARQMRQRSAMMTAQTEASFATSGFVSATKFTRLALQSLALALGAWLAVDNLISGGAIFASSFLIARALAPIEQLIGNWKPLSQAWQSYGNLRLLLAAETLHAAGTQLPAPQGRLAVEGITILNDARDGTVLNDVSFAVNPGEVLAIVGASGAGKSTLVRAIAGARPHDRGVVRIDGADARDWDPERLARYIGYLPQDSILFAGTIAENIARFSSEIEADRLAIDAAVVAAARKVGADGLIQRLANGYDHVLKLGGRGVSAGQAQRIALARAVYGSPRLLILDEPNAHLDAEGDAALVAALAALKAERCTVLIVSHKLSILPVVDKMLVLRDGKVELFGTRDQVLAKITPPKVARVTPPAGAPI
jgi:ATP-binding cassette subfamily C exporter for protease/lipase